MAFDTRVKRHALALAEAGHEVTSIGVLNRQDREAPRLSTPAGLRYDWADRRPRSFGHGRVSWLTSNVLHRGCVNAWRWGLRARSVAYRIAAPAYDPLLRAARRYDADVYYANDANTLPVALAVAKRTGGKLIYDAHEFYLHEVEQLDRVIADSIKYVEGQGLRSAAAWITVSPLIGEELAKIYGCAPPVVVRNLPDIISDVEVGPVPDHGQPLRILYHSANLALQGRHLKDLIDAGSELGRDVCLTL